MKVRDLARWLAPRFVGYLWAVLGTLAGSLLLGPVRSWLDLPNVALLYVLGVVMVAVRYGRGPSVAAALASALCYAYIFVPPHFSLAITEGQNLMAAAIMLIVALLVGHLTSRLRQHAALANRQSRESATLYRLARELAGLPTSAQVIAAVADFLGKAFMATDVRVLAPGTAGPPVATVEPLPGEPRRVAVRMPLLATDGDRGILAFAAAAELLDSAGAVAYLETIASVLAVALERSHFAEMARETEVKHAAETLRSSILSALSHDLRTPLTALVGMSETAALPTCPPERQRRLLGAIRNQALSISQQMTNLLDMARLSTGKLQINTAWQPVEEVIGVTVQQVRQHWRDRELTVDVPADLPPINIDAVLIERVLWNLVENAIKYSPADTPVELSARRQEDSLEIAVCDSGSGVPAEQHERIFDLFQRGKAESDIPGVGLGLSIARTIVEAHGGTLAVSGRLGGGSCFRMALPLGDPPPMDLLEEAP